MTDDEVIIQILQDALSRSDDESLARQRLAAGEPNELSGVPTAIREYVEALHVELRRLQDEVERLRGDFEELESLKDTDFYVESEGAEAATFGEEIEPLVNWDALYGERQRLHALERTLQDAQGVNDALGRRDLNALAVSVDRLLRRVKGLEEPDRRD